MEHEREDEMREEHQQTRRNAVKVVGKRKSMFASRVTLRSVWKGPFFVPLPAARDGAAVQTMARASTILPSHVGRKFMVHNGKEYLPVLVSEQMVNRKLGEFAPTRKPFTFKKSDKKGR
ncbi:hypothetical protein BC830DRAFT_1126839 [Chytriomyces sp. MP71]|nr:hypothetical protein BC830DRAFT_1126839 [Chytriomyces sp. MP71]